MEPFESPCRPELVATPDKMRQARPWTMTPHAPQPQKPVAIIAVGVRYPDGTGAAASLMFPISQGVADKLLLLIAGFIFVGGLIILARAA